MTTHAHKRCHHCQMVYTYQGSGHGCFEPLNDHEYCTDCKQVILDALALVPKRFEKVLVETTEVTALELQALETERWEATKAKGGIPMRRVSPGLFDMVDPSNKESRGITGRDGCMYHWNYWSKDPEGTSEVRVEMERDLTTGEKVPWRNYR